MRYIVLSHIRYIASPVVKNSLTDVGTWRSAIPHGGPLGDPVLLHGRADASEQDQHTAEKFDHDRHERPSGCRMSQVGQLASCQHSTEDEDSRHRGRHRWHPADAGYHQAGQPVCFQRRFRSTESARQTSSLITSRRWGVQTGKR